MGGGLNNQNPSVYAVIRENITLSTAVKLPYNKTPINKIFYLSKYFG